jgi:hypothetical protein
MGKSLSHMGTTRPGWRGLFPPTEPNVSSRSMTGGVNKTERTKSLTGRMGFLAAVLFSGFVIFLCHAGSRIRYFDPTYKIVRYRVVRSGAFTVYEDSPVEVSVKKALRRCGLPITLPIVTGTVEAHGPIPSIHVVCAAYRQVRGELVDNAGRVSPCDGGFASLTTRRKTIHSGAWSLNPRYRDPDSVYRFRLKDWDTGVQLAEIDIGKIPIQILHPSNAQLLNGHNNEPAAHGLPRSQSSSSEFHRH